jgi:hypothetical protein
MVEGMMLKLTLRKTLCVWLLTQRTLRVRFFLRDANRIREAVAGLDVTWSSSCIEQNGSVCRRVEAPLLSSETFFIHVLYLNYFLVHIK